MKNELVRIRLLADHLKTHTGEWGNYAFEDGVSELMLRREAERLSVITSVEFVDAENMWERKRRERGLITSDGFVEDEPVEETVEPPSPTVRYSRSDLEAIADKDGIAGLRKIADQFNVKGTSIRQLLEVIEKAQHGNA